MKRILYQYIQIIAYSLLGLAFGFAFFYLFLNVYHYRELRREVFVDFDTDSSVLQLQHVLDTVQNNIQQFQTSNYHGTLEYQDALFWNSRLQVCVQKFNNDTIREVLSKDSISIKDVYDLRESFENDVLNGCVVTHLYSLIGEDSVDSDFIRDNQKLLKYYMDDLLQDTAYLKKDLNANSSYYFTTDTFSFAVKNNVKDGFYEVLSSYNRAANFLEVVSDWYQEEAGGTL